MIVHLHIRLLLYGAGYYCFQQDGAPCHTARNTVSWLKERVRLLKHWPANSPDFNVIEHLWGTMKAGVRKARPKSKEELKQCLLKIWDAFDQGSLDRMCGSTKYRMALAIEHKGESIEAYLRRRKSDLSIAVPTVPDVESFDDMVSDIDHISPDNGTWQGPLFVLPRLHDEEVASRSEDLLLRGGTDPATFGSDMTIP